jgi:hypothetical protein
MNHHAVLLHLREAAEELNHTPQEMEQDSSYSEESLGVDMGHLYHRLNRAWNGRHQTHDQHVSCTDEDFYAFRRFLKENEFLYLEPPERRAARSRGRWGQASVRRRMGSTRRR